MRRGVYVLSVRRSGYMFVRRELFVVSRLRLYTALQAMHNDLHISWRYSVTDKDYNNDKI